MGRLALPGGVRGAGRWALGWRCRNPGTCFSKDSCLTRAPTTCPGPGPRGCSSQGGLGSMWWDGGLQGSRHHPAPTWPLGSCLKNEAFPKAGLTVLGAGLTFAQGAAMLKRGTGVANQDAGNKGLLKPSHSPAEHGPQPTDSTGHLAHSLGIPCFALLLLFTRGCYVALTTL